MTLLRTIAGSAVAAVITGAVGFASAYYLQENDRRLELQQMQQAHELELARMAASNLRSKEERQDARSNALYVEWMSDPLRTDVKVARAVFDKSPGLSYADLRAPERSMDKEAVDAVLGFWGRIDDAAAAQQMNATLTATLLGPDARYWGLRIKRLLKGVSPDTDGLLILAARGVAFLGYEDLGSLPERGVVARSEPSSEP
jgi:hypothetical protein